MGEFWQGVAIAYSVITFVACLGAGLAKVEGMSKDNPLIYVFWPIVAINALALHIVRGWKS